MAMTIGQVDLHGFVLCVLAVWRIAHLFTREDGPFEAVVKLRQAAGQGGFGQLLDCFYCLSLWIAAPFVFVLVDTWITGVVTWLALSGGASLLYTATDAGKT